MAIIPAQAWYRRLVARGDLTQGEAQGVADALIALGREANLDPEDFFIAGQALMVGGQELGAGGVGTRSMVQLMNESDVPSGAQLAIVTDVAMGSDVGTKYQIRYHDTPLGTVSNRGIFRDRQWVPGTGIGLGPSIRIRQDVTLAAAGTIVLGNLRKPAGDTLQMHGDPLFILGPAQGLVLCSAADQQEIDAVFFWRELNIRIRV
jgi:hypothetical protein